jgi:hypothetical protein
VSDLIIIIGSTSVASNDLCVQCNVYLIVHLSKTHKKGKAAKEKLIGELTECLDLFSRLFVFSVENMRNESFKDVRKDFNGSRYYCTPSHTITIIITTLH